MQRLLGIRRFSFVLLACMLVFASPASAKKLQVYTTFTIIADMARHVAGDVAEVNSLTKPGAEIHNYQPTPKDILRGVSADIILWNGMNLELWFEQFVQHMPDAVQVRVSEGITPIDIREGDYSGKPNPHAWMSPKNAMIYVENIRDALVQADPAHAEAYRQNAAEYMQQIQSVIVPLQAKIAQIPEEQRWLVTSEGAFSYFAHDFAMKELYMWPMNVDQVGTPQQVKKVIDQVVEHQIPVVFSESTVSPKPMQQVANETNSLYGGILYVDSLSDPKGEVPTYLDLLRVTSENILQGFASAGVI